MKEQGRIQNGIPGIGASFEVDAVTYLKTVYDDMSGKPLNPEGVEQARGRRDE